MAVIPPEERDEAILELGLPQSLAAVARGNRQSFSAFDWIEKVEDEFAEPVAAGPHPEGPRLLLIGSYDMCTYLAARKHERGWEIIEFVEGAIEHRRVARTEIGFFAWGLAVMLRSGAERKILEASASTIGFPYLAELCEWSARSAKRYPDVAYEEDVRCALAADIEEKLVPG